MNKHIHSVIVETVPDGIPIRNQRDVFKKNLTRVPYPYWRKDLNAKGYYDFDNDL